jgi:hypothetical protein
MKDRELEARIDAHARIVADAQMLWLEALPDHEVPCACQFYQWLNKANGSRDDLCAAIQRTGRKWRTCRRYGTEMDDYGVVRYMTSLTKRATEGTLVIQAVGRATKNKAGIRRLEHA